MRRRPTSRDQSRPEGLETRFTGMPRACAALQRVLSCALGRRTCWVNSNPSTSSGGQNDATETCSGFWRFWPRVNPRLRCWTLLWMPCCTALRRKASPRRVHNADSRRDNVRCRNKSPPGAKPIHHPGWPADHPPPQSDARARFHQGDDYSSSSPSPSHSNLSPLTCSAGTAASQPAARSASSSSSSRSSSPRTRAGPASPHCPTHALVTDDSLWKSTRTTSPAPR